LVGWLVFGKVGGWVVKVSKAKEKETGCGARRK
jgi:hypothetical protein